ncbi:MAG TPA: DNA-3-methyladenine glycosylase [Candidatus Dormibacteraeota bacterium]|nr:DNA-3-methyladenine glycosylase [Candidatus Dormibacteraeota bacterium]
MSSTTTALKEAQTKIFIRRIRRSELPEDTVKLARFLIGKVVVHDLPAGRVSGRIVETEAYPPGDPAGHHFRGPTPRIRSMYLAPGHVYVFFNYGAHFMLNVVSEPSETAAAILIRALEPLEGIEIMQRHRKTKRLLDLTRGPGRLAKALQIDRRHDSVDLCAGGKLWLGGIDHPAGPIGKSVRIGITRAADKLLRFFERGNPFVSGPKRLLHPLPKRRDVRKHGT